VTALVVPDSELLRMPASSKTVREIIGELKRKGEQAACLSRLTFRSKKGSASREIWDTRTQIVFVDYELKLYQLKLALAKTSKFRITIHGEKPIEVDRTDTLVFVEEPNLDLTEPNPFNWGGIRLGLNGRPISIAHIDKIEVL